MTRAAALGWATHLISAQRNGETTRYDALVRLLADLYDVQCDIVRETGDYALMNLLTNLKERTA